MRGAFGAVVAAFFAVALASPAHALDWRVSRLVDPFTDATTCRIEPGGEFSRGLVRGLTGSFRTLHFFVENRDGEIRAGLMSEPLIAIPGDVQVRVDQNPMLTITAADTPIDAGPTIAIPDTPGLSPEQRAQLEQTMRSSLAVASPYRVLVGDRARDLLRQLVGGREAIWRVVGINAATSQTGTIRIRGLAEALGECGIDLAEPAPPQQAPAEQ